MEADAILRGISRDSYVIYTDGSRLPAVEAATNTRGERQPYVPQSCGAGWTILKDDCSSDSYNRTLVVMRIGPWW